MWEQGRTGRAVVSCCILLSLLGSSIAGAQTARLEGLARMLRSNRQELGGYRWKSRTEISLEGEIRQVSLVQAHYGQNGALIEIPLPDQSAPSRPTKKKMQKKIRAFHEELRTLTRAYFELDPQRMQAALAGAHAWEGQGERGDQLRVQARSVIRQADRLDLWIDGVTNSPLRLEVLTSLQGEAVRMTTEFARLKDGPSYASNIVVETELKEKKMTVRTTNFDHVRRTD